jgi:hypothetical protein
VLHSTKIPLSLICQLKKQPTKRLTDIKESIAIEKHLENDLNIKPPATGKQFRVSGFEFRVLQPETRNPKLKTRNSLPEAKS